jgi:hypothetical protein
MKKETKTTIAFIIVFLLMMLIPRTGHAQKYFPIIVHEQPADTSNTLWTGYYKVLKVKKWRHKTIAKIKIKPDNIISDTYNDGNPVLNGHTLHPVFYWAHVADTVKKNDTISITWLIKP